MCKVHRYMGCALFVVGAVASKLNYSRASNKIRILGNNGCKDRLKCNLLYPENNPMFVAEYNFELLLVKRMEKDGTIM